MSEETTTNNSEVLIVVSKLKNYIRSASGFNTSSSVAEVLSQLIRDACSTAIENARKEGRKTVMDRDFASCTSSTTSCSTTSMSNSPSAAA